MNGAILVTYSHLSKGVYDPNIDYGKLSEFEAMEGTIHMTSSCIPDFGQILPVQVPL